MQHGEADANLDQDMFYFILRPDQSIQFIAVEAVGKFIAVVPADTDLLRQEFPGPLNMDQWLSGAGKPLLRTTIQAKGATLTFC